MQQKRCCYRQLYGITAAESRVIVQDNKMTKCVAGGNLCGKKISSTISRCCLVFQKARLSLHVKKSHSWPIECVGVTIRCPLAWRRNAFSGKAFHRLTGWGEKCSPLQEIFDSLGRTVFARKPDAATLLVGIIGGGCSCTWNIFHLPTLNKQRRHPQGFYICFCFWCSSRDRTRYKLHP